MKYNNIVAKYIEVNDLIYIDFPVPEGNYTYTIILYKHTPRESSTILEEVGTVDNNVPKYIQIGIDKNYLRENINLSYSLTIEGDELLEIFLGALKLTSNENILANQYPIPILTEFREVSSNVGCFCGCSCTCNDDNENNGGGGEIDPEPPEPEVLGFVIESPDDLMVGKLTKITAYYMSDIDKLPVPVTWSSDDVGIADINADGDILGVSEGSVVIHAQDINDSRVKGSIEIDILPELPCITPSDVLYFMGFSSTCEEEITTIDWFGEIISVSRFLNLYSYGNGNLLGETTLKTYIGLPILNVASSTISTNSTSDEYREIYSRESPAVITIHLVLDSQGLDLCEELNLSWENGDSLDSWNEFPWQYQIGVVNIEPNETIRRHLKLNKNSRGEIILEASIILDSPFFSYDNQNLNFTIRRA